MLMIIYILTTWQNLSCNFWQRVHSGPNVILALWAMLENKMRSCRYYQSNTMKHYLCCTRGWKALDKVLYSQSLSQIYTIENNDFELDVRVISSSHHYIFSLVYVTSSASIIAVNISFALTSTLFCWDILSYAGNFYLVNSILKYNLGQWIQLIVCEVCICVSKDTNARLLAPKRIKQHFMVCETRQLSHHKAFDLKKVKC